MPAANGATIAVVERGVCDFVVKQAAVEAAGGYLGMIVFNREGADGCSGGGHDDDQWHDPGDVH